MPVRTGTCDAAGCRVHPPLDDAGHLPPGWRLQPPPPPGEHAFRYCADHAFRYRGRTPMGLLCGPPPRRAGRVRRSRRVLRPYSIDRQPCSCGLPAHHLVAVWGTRWRIPQDGGHRDPAACPVCAGTLHICPTATRCLTCGEQRFYDHPNDDY